MDIWEEKVRVELEGGIKKSHEQSLEGHGYVLYLECGNGFHGCMHMSKLTLHTLNKYNLLQVNYTQ